MPSRNDGRKGLFFVERTVVYDVPYGGVTAFGGGSAVYGTCRTLFGTRLFPERTKRSSGLGYFRKVPNALRDSAIPRSCRTLFGTRLCPESTEQTSGLGYFWKVPNTTELGYFPNLPNVLRVLTISGNCRTLFGCRLCRKLLEHFLSVAHFRLLFLRGAVMVGVDVNVSFASIQNPSPSAILEPHTKQQTAGCGSHNFIRQAKESRATYFCRRLATVPLKGDFRWADGRQSFHSVER
ncbi:uncharacterized protein [Heptranchias perlo]|uniref:uncharacterized protein n=1 Tax=Heptranchias perlo TaxID=212740 RepID=UPI0035597BE6